MELQKQQADLLLGIPMEKEEPGIHELGPHLKESRGIRVTEEEDRVEVRSELAESPDIPSLLWRERQVPRGQVD